MTDDGSRESEVGSQKSPDGGELKKLQSVPSPLQGKVAFANANDGRGC